MKIIVRYITKEIFWAFTVITAILLLIVLSNRFAIYLAKAASGELPVGLVFQVVGLYIPELLIYLIPLGLFIALLFAYGRLYADSEMTILAACGVSLRYIIYLTMVFAVGVMFITALLTLWIAPKVASTRANILSEGENFSVIQSLVPGRFQTFAKEGVVFYLESITSNKDLKGVFIAEHPENPTMATKTNDQSGWTFITAEGAKLERDEKTKAFYLVAKQGYRYKGVPGNADYTLVEFKEYGRAIPQVISPVEEDVFRLKKSSALFTSSSPEDAAELQWRLSLPLTIPILALLAVPFARVRPRQGRFAKFLPAIVIYIVYYNLFLICKRWVASGAIPSLVGVWWVHGLFFLLGLTLLAKESGYLIRLRHEYFR